MVSNLPDNNSNIDLDSTPKSIKIDEAYGSIQKN
ncbi:MAG: hypothetical protein CM15mP102_21240 [Flavobacteriales bacterium]|nr:MAG: hypothetical protein CM15mP102_21240 [Flavobacteriales bacterium]